MGTGYPSNDGWVLGAGGFVLNTTDGGENWTEEDLAVPYFADICFADSLNGWAAGYGGTITKIDHMPSTGYRHGHTDPSMMLAEEPSFSWREGLHWLEHTG